ncbi:hypothetical protein SAMD00019534_058550 [Acytostelium subglobosum LB1]|uniref:hypothetical protein n=1 Tax=Acytostelium subglobosum LB1 TaxID=1410327 RepID=UPI0006449250|nr:hypothetical protein SAMD00019534_058550 [Acytostelium subglobosum LB1]GAM22680.1 hypothetical protein SAMD00019534_058550 [Acytostelium subglobosum LB1]|eukprot:XP_012754800.1 hypothetical protein SAMD00019534_058550 [Acytostelium subglobosum LB1]
MLTATRSSSALFRRLSTVLSTSNNNMIISSSSCYSFNHSYSTATATAATEQTSETTTPSPKTTVKQYKLNPASPLQFPINPITNINSIKPRGVSEKLPFHFERTDSGRLPVYTDLIRSRRTEETVLRRYSGDVNVIIQELRNIVGDNVEITQREGTIRLKGKYTTHLLIWLSALGF